MLIEIRHRHTNKVLYACEAKNTCEALLSALKNSADLRSADLRSANLRSANLRSADLSFADLSSADLRSADLRSANLSFADLRSANLRYADLRYADLRYADLDYADLRYADLSSADLSFADLRSADLRSADLRSANLSGEILAISPLFVNGLIWDICITESFMKIGCKRYTHKEWAKFADSEIKKMESLASSFWASNKTWLIAACKSHRKESLKFRKVNP
jgi:hypothetical protein